MKAAFTQRRALSQSAFTMVEIAISMAVIGFALVAIIGILPAGLTVQKENREETIINQDANYLLEAIRSGSTNLYDLTNYFDRITLTNYRNTLPDPNGIAAFPNDFYQRPETIVGLLSRPKYFPGTTFTNIVTANVRAISGSAVEKAPQRDTGVRDLSFAYRLISEIVPYSGFDTNATNFQAAGLSTAEAARRRDMFRIVRNMQTNLYELRLTFRWPLLPNGGTGPGRQTYRALLGGRPNTVDLSAATANLKLGTPLYFFDPRSYATVPSPP